MTNTPPTDFSSFLIFTGLDLGPGVLHPSIRNLSSEYQKKAAVAKANAVFAKPFVNAAMAGRSGKDLFGLFGQPSGKLSLPIVQHALAMATRGGRCFILDDRTMSREDARDAEMLHERVQKEALVFLECLLDFTLQPAYTPSSSIEFDLCTPGFTEAVLAKRAGLTRPTLLDEASYQRELGTGRALKF